MIPDRTVIWMLSQDNVWLKDLSVLRLDYAVQTSKIYSKIGSDITHA